MLYLFCFYRHDERQRSEIISNAFFSMDEIASHAMAWSQWRTVSSLRATKERSNLTRVV